MPNKKINVDYMAIGAHADDVELMAGGTILKLSSLGKQGVVLDLTDASAGTRGTPEIRLKEAANAAKILGLQTRDNLGFPDSQLTNSWEYQKPVIKLIRKYRPKILLTHYLKSDHPDHTATSSIVKDACFKSGLKNLNCEGVPFRPFRIFYFMDPDYFEPSFCVDISSFWKKKMKAILCYKSQFYGKSSKNISGKTDISSKSFLEYLEMKHRFFGHRIKKKYAEPFYCKEIPEVNDITALGDIRF
jgi:bacillithiol biosynthesis deacetylase BshB1